MPISLNFPTKSYVDTQLASKQNALIPGDGIEITNNIISVTNSEYVTKYEDYTVSSIPVSVSNNISAQDVQVTWHPSGSGTSVPAFTNMYDKTQAVWPYHLSGTYLSFLLNGGNPFTQDGKIDPGHKIFIGIHVTVASGSTVSLQGVDRKGSFTESFWWYDYSEYPTSASQSSWNATLQVTSGSDEGCVLDSIYVINLDPLISSGEITLPSSQADKVTYLTNIFKEITLAPGGSYSGSGGTPVITRTRDGLNSTLIYPNTTLNVKAGDSLVMTGGTAEFTASYQEARGDDTVALKFTLDDGSTVTYNVRISQ